MSKQENLDRWSGSWSPYTMVDEAGTFRQLYKASMTFSERTEPGGILELLNGDGELLDRESIPAGLKGSWPHGFWIPISGAEQVLRSTWRLSWICSGEALANREVTIPPPNSDRALPLRLDRLGERLRLHLAEREGAALQVGPSSAWRSAQPLAHVSQHDVIYEKPSREWDEGLPIGNGDLGALVCGEEGSEQTIYLDKTDIWFATETEEPVGRCYAATLRLRYSWSENGPVREPFKQRLSLADGEVVTLDSPFFFSARVQAERNCFELEVQGPAEGEVSVELERRSIPLPPFSPGSASTLNGSWINTWTDERLNKARQAVAAAPRSRLEWGGGGRDHERDLWCVHRGPNIEFAVVMRVEGGLVTSTYRNHGDARGCAIFELRLPTSGRLRVLAAVVTSRESEAPLVHAKELLDSCESPEEDARAHREWWRGFWERSWIELPDKLEENLWYLGIYNQACVSRGPQAVGFFGLWHPLDNRTWRDAYVTDAQVPMMWWSCFATNHMALLYPSHNTFGAAAVECAEHTPQAGMVVPHWFDPVWAGGHRLFAGQNPYKGSTAWYTLNFWWDYLYSGDEILLRDLTYPILRMAADQFCENLVRGEDGRFHCHESGAPEQSGTDRDNIYDWALITELLRAVLQASEVLDLDPEGRARWAYLLDHLFEPPGDGDRIWECPDVPQPYRCHPVVMMGVYPTGAIGYRSPEFDALRRTLPTVTNILAFRYEDRHDPQIPGHEGGVETNGFSSGMLTIAHTRLGDWEGYRRCIYGLILRFHLKRNGLRAIIDPRHEDKISRSSLVEAANAHTVAITDTLIQSWPDHIRLFPCVGPGNYRFSGLRAFGGFVISAQLEEGTLTGAEIGSLRAGRLELASPWPPGGVMVEERAGDAFRPAEVEWVSVAGEQRMRLDTQAGALYRIRTETRDGSQAQGIQASVPPPRSSPRYVAIDEAESAGGGFLHYPEDLPFGQVVQDGFLYLGNPAKPRAPRLSPALETIVSLAQSGDWRARQEAARILGRKGYDEGTALRYLLLLCDDPVSVVAHTAGLSLVRIGTQRSLDLARDLARRSGVQGLKREIEKALSRWRREADTRP